MITTTIGRISMRTTDRGVTYTTAGRDARGRFSRSPVRLVQTRRGHWYRTDDQPDDLHNDTLCRGCGCHGHFDYILDYQPCTAPADTTQVLAALGSATNATPSVARAQLAHHGPIRPVLPSPRTGLITLPRPLLSLFPLTRSPVMDDSTLPINDTAPALPAADQTALTALWLATEHASARFLAARKEFLRLSWRVTSLGRLVKEHPHRADYRAALTLAAGRLIDAEARTDLATTVRDRAWRVYDAKWSATVGRQPAGRVAV